MERVITYIDGFNLYFGLKSKNWKRFYWLDIQKLSSSILKENQYLERVKYFTAKISLPPDKVKRQTTFIEALETIYGIEITYGKYQAHTVECFNCGNQMNKPNEKMTDVNIATAMIIDAFEDKYDTAILISADSDLKGPITKIKEKFPNKRIVCAFPPKRFSVDLKKIVDAHFTIGRRKFNQSLLPE